MRQLRLLLVVLVLAIASGPALAADPAGWWSSSSGARVYIWANMRVVRVTVVASNGTKREFDGYWTRFGDDFSYRVPRAGVYRAAIDPRNENRIYVRGPSGSRTVWTRGRSADRRTSRRGSISGTWRSSSGSIVQVTSRGRQVSIRLITRQGRRYQGAGRWLDGRRFDYSVVGFKGVAYGTVINIRRIEVNYRGKISVWTR